jgi:hypothetical protein
MLPLVVTQELKELSVVHNMTQKRLDLMEAKFSSDSGGSRHIFFYVC